MSDDERQLLFERLDAFDRSVWAGQRLEAKRAFHAAGLTDDAIDEAVRRLRYQGRP